MLDSKNLGILAVAITLASSGPIAASSDATSTSYDASYEYDVDATVQKLDETMTLRRGEPQASITLTSSGGASFDGPATIATDGEISAVTSDPSVTCYNMAAATRYQNMHAPDRPNYVYVRAGNGIVRIPMTITQSKAADGTTTLTGNGVQTVDVQSGDGTVALELTVGSKIRIVGTNMVEISFDQETAAGADRDVISRQSCTLRPADGPAPLA